MAVHTAELKQQRHAVIEDCKGILNKCDAEKRSLTVEERKTYDAKWAEATRLTTEIDGHEKRNELEALEADKEFRRRHGEAPDGASGPTFRTDKGEYIRGLRHGESFRSAIGDTGGEIPSLGKMIYGQITGDWRGADLERRTLNSIGTNTAGGFSAPTSTSARIIDLARAQSVVSAAGAMTLPLTTEETTVALIETDPTAYWTPEGATITESEGTFGAVVLRSRALAVYCEASLELIRNATNAQTIIEGTIAQALGLGLDEACLNGNGSGEKPTGLLNSSRVTASAVGGAFTYDALLNAMGLCWASNVEPKAWLMENTLRKYVSKLKTGEGEWLQLPPEAAGLKRLMSTQLQSADANGTCYVGDFANCIIGIRSGIEIEANGAGDVFKKKRIAIRGLLFADFAVGRSGDVVKMTGITGL